LRERRDRPADVPMASGLTAGLGGHVLGVRLGLSLPRGLRAGGLPTLEGVTQHGILGIAVADEETVRVRQELLSNVVCSRAEERWRILLRF
jgi:hypothetical protein